MRLLRLTGTVVRVADIGAALDLDSDLMMNTLANRFLNGYIGVM